MSVTFDEHNLVPNAGLIAPATLAQRLGIADLVQHTVRLDKDRPGAANCGAKAMTVLGGMLAGGEGIDDLDVGRVGAASQLFDDLRAPSTMRDLAAVLRLGQASVSSTRSAASR